MINWIKILYGNHMRIYRRGKHAYLGMNLDLLVNVQVAVTMVYNLKGLISDFEELEILTGTSESPATKHLYTIREEFNQKKLD